jgi:hypothetical protein
MILPGDTVVVFPNGTFSGIDGLTIRMKASSNEELAADSFNPKPKNVVTMETRTHTTFFQLRAAKFQGARRNESQRRDGHHDYVIH